MHPDHRLSFEDWVAKLVKKGILHSASTFKTEDVVENFWLLPEFWIGMTPDERLTVIETIQSHQSEFTPACLQSIHERCNIPYSDMRKVRLCFHVSMESPGTVSYTGTERPAALAPPTEQQIHLEKLAAAASASKGLVNFELKPAGVHGVDLLDHMLTFAKRRLPSRSGQRLQPSVYLDVAMTDDQQMLLDPTPEDLLIRNVLIDAGGDGATKKLAKRKLDSVGFVNAYSCHANSETRLKRFRQAAQLSDSLAEISQFAQAESAAKKADEADKFKCAAPAALKVLRGRHNNEIGKLKVSELRAIAYEYYNHTIPSSGLLKPAVVEIVTKLYLEKPYRLDQVVLIDPVPPVINTEVVTTE
jgi:hypothetical protein